MKTTIHRLIRKELPLINAHEETNAIREYLISQQALLVVTEQQPLGLITTVDIARQQQHLLGDCLVPKPFVQAEFTVEEVLQIMKLSGFSVLPVKDTSGAITGAVFIDDIVQYLFQKTLQQQAAVQTMAHDLKSPLANISSINSLLQQDESPSDESRELLHYVSMSVDLARDIVNDLLMSEKLETDDLVLTRLEVNELILSCLPSVQGLLAHKQLTLNTSLLPAPCFFMGDKLKLQRVVHNLLSNAIKFSNYQSIITLTCFQASNNFTLQISDEGIGIPESLQMHVFEKFTRARRPGTAGEGSTGLGMYITHEIVRMHKGDIWFKSGERTGTTFYVRLPFNPFTVQV